MYWSYIHKDFLRHKSLKLKLFPNDRILLSRHTSRWFCVYSAVHAVWLEVGHPSIHQSRFEDLPVVEILSGPMVIPQVIHGLHMILLLCGEDGVECLQLQQKREAERQRKNILNVIFPFHLILFCKGIYNINLLWPRRCRKEIDKCMLGMTCWIK